MNTVKFKVGDKVKLIANIEGGKMYGGLIFHDIMKFEGEREILPALYGSIFYRVGEEPDDWYWYSEEMLTT